MPCCICAHRQTYISWRWRQMTADSANLSPTGSYWVAWRPFRSEWWLQVLSLYGRITNQLGNNFKRRAELASLFAGFRPEIEMTIEIDAEEHLISIVFDCRVVVVVVDVGIINHLGYISAAMRADRSNNSTSFPFTSSAYIRHHRLYIEVALMVQVLAQTRQKEIAQTMLLCLS